MPEQAGLLVALRKARLERLKRGPRATPKEEEDSDGQETKAKNVLDAIIMERLAKMEQRLAAIEKNSKSTVEAIKERSDVAPAPS